MQGLMPEIFHKEFPGLIHLEMKLEEIKSREIEGLLEKVEEEREELVNLLLDGIQYYQRYQANMLTWLIQVTITNIKLGQIDPLACAGHLCSLYLPEHGKSVERIGSVNPDEHSHLPPSATHPGGNAPCNLLLCLPDSLTLPPDPLLPGSSLCLAPSSLNALQFQVVLQHLSSDKNSPWYSRWISARPRLHRCFLP